MLVGDGFDCLIAAGGMGKRLDSRLPKCSIEVNGKSLLEISIEQAQGAGARNILVLCDNTDWFQQASEIVSGFCGAYFKRDIGYMSTFNLCLDYAPLMARRFLFLYSHAPRPSDKLKCFLDYSSIGQIGGLVNHSSRRDPILQGTLYVEPPFLLDKNLFLSSKASSWSDYVRKYSETFSFIPLKGPPEFNFACEREEFLQYVSWAA